MSEYHLKSKLEQATRVDRPISRIDGLVQQTKMMTDRVRSTTERIVRHANALGFFSPESRASDVPMPPQPFITSLEDALREHDRALDELAAALNLFD